MALNVTLGNDSGLDSARRKTEMILNLSKQITTTQEIPREMTFNDDGLIAVTAYSCLFVIAAFGNLTVFLTLFRSRHRKSRVNMFIMHLCIADLLTTFVMMPLETAWHITVEWKASDAACRILMFFRAFGFYLSSFVLIAISLDRYFAIAHPMSIMDAGRRAKIMLIFAWLCSTIASIPQSIIFHLVAHPVHKGYNQCATFGFYPTPAHELAYQLFNVIAIYVVPLLVIVISYTLILCEMSKRYRQGRDEMDLPTYTTQNGRRHSKLRRSCLGHIERARVRTLKMTIVIVLVFILCWTPYYFILAWYWIDKVSAQNIDRKVQRGLFLFAVSNSCMNPIIYGMFTNNFIRDFRRCCWCARVRMRKSSSEERLQGSQGHHSARYDDACGPGQPLRRHEPFIKVKSISSAANHHNDKFYMDNSTCSSCASGSRMRMSPIIVASPRFNRINVINAVDTI
ncbi:adipokinetic hormone/corazonin-related peptide receptor variant I-like isoform X2 [Lineus longissimus]|uniref:adipokinetic hormone/corazonin-related peptide receptor variant I-like isoform X2 n=1 Tax=Lineus longissimus TaxID=88925 RepID=UPI00315D0BBF